MSVLEKFRERKLRQLHLMLERSGMFASTAGEAYVSVAPLVEDLQELYDREDRNRGWASVAPGPDGRWDEYGVPGIARWFEGRESRCVAEVMSCYAEVAARLGLLKLQHRYDAAAWSRAGFADGERLRGLRVHRDRVTDVVGPPSFIVDRRIFCFAHEDDAEGWVFLDFETWQGPDHNPLLRNVRLPWDPARAGLIMTS